MKNFVEIAVIGGGVIGTAITYYLAKAGFDVCLIERNGIAEGTSGRCDGRVIVYDQVPGESCRLAKMSLDLFPQLPDELGFDIGWSQEGT
ncbi:MAG: FAD-binding oxidoreductase, partial [Deltaproteobacteria bacterium]|nr:FAD-binding oxidoreductase [Deltaproteobacteria bacterium]